MILLPALQQTAHRLKIERLHASLPPGQLQLCRPLVPVRLQPAPAAAEVVAHVRLCVRAAGLRQPKAAKGPLVVNLRAVAVGIAYAQVILRIGIAALGRLLKIGEGPAIIHVRPPPPQAALPQFVQDLGGAGSRLLQIPRIGLVLILRRGIVRRPY